MTSVILFVTNTTVLTFHHTTKTTDLTVVESEFQKLRLKIGTEKFNADNTHMNNS